VNLLHLRVLREIARSESLASAADSLGYTPSAVSRHLAALERDTGHRLVNRDPTGVTLTRAGRRLLAHADAILMRVDIAQAELSFADLDEGSDRITVAAFENALATFVPRAVRGLQQRRPGVQTSLQVCRPLSVRDVARSSAADVAIGLMQPFDAGTARDVAAELEITPLLEDELLCVIPRNHPLAQQDQVHLSDLADEAWALSHSDRCPMYLEFSRVCGEHGFSPRRVYELDDIPATLGIVASGAALSVIPSILLGPNLTDVAYLRFDTPIRTVAAAFTRTTEPDSAPAILLQELVNAAARFHHEVVNQVRDAADRAISVGA
jgi:DNA-binding transcriptional LysR family regulator